jgi:drug/metabolite transporter (DMT)-like permease
MEKKYLAYGLLIIATLSWSANFIVGKFSTLFLIPPLSLNFFRWLIVWFILLPFFIVSVIKQFHIIKANFGLLFLMGITSTGLFNSLVYTALNYTQVVNAVLMISVIPIVVAIFSSMLGVEQSSRFHYYGLVLSLMGVGTIIFKGSLDLLLQLNFNQGDLWMVAAVIAWAIYSTLLKKKKLPFTQFELIFILTTIGTVFLIPQFLYEQVNGYKTNFNLAFYLIVTFIVIFPAMLAYYCWQKAIEIIGPNRASIFLHLMPIFGAIMALIIFNEQFVAFHYIGTVFIVSGIYISNRKA